MLMPSKSDFRMVSTLTCILVYCSFSIGEFIFALPLFNAVGGYLFANLQIVILGFTSIILYTGVVEACSTRDLYNYGCLLKLYFGESSAKIGLLAIAIKYTLRSMWWLFYCTRLIYAIFIYINPSSNKDFFKSTEYILISLAFLVLVTFLHYQAGKVNKILKLRYLSYFIIFTWIYMIILSIVWPPVNHYEEPKKENIHYDNFWFAWLNFCLFIMDTSSIQCIPVILKETNDVSSIKTIICCGTFIIMVLYFLIGNIGNALNPNFKEFIELVTFSPNNKNMSYQELENIPWVIGAFFTSVSSISLSIFGLYTSRLCVNQIVDLNFQFDPYRNRVISLSLIGIVIAMLSTLLIDFNNPFVSIISLFLITSGYVAEMAYPYLVYLRYQANNIIKTLFGVWYFFWICPIWVYIILIVLRVVDSF
ncbi:unnamed protein product [Blepharisma stoltei]|uniref:Amino acid transporter n=1 Tax=Blepharisma stoltei TaxID=1481888 RepID=A0AAU9IVJ3_9CILI|nr:unnamed protein product [Blepharisma stoltei]